MARSTHVTSLDPQCLHLLVERTAVGQRRDYESCSSLELTHKNLRGSTTGDLADRPFSYTIHLCVKGGTPEHRDLGALTDSPTLTPWP